MAVVLVIAAVVGGDRWCCGGICLVDIKRRKGGKGDEWANTPTTTTNQHNIIQ